MEFNGPVPLKDPYGGIANSLRICKHYGIVGVALKSKGRAGTE